MSLFSNQAKNHTEAAAQNNNLDRCKCRKSIVELKHAHVKETIMYKTLRMYLTQSMQKSVAIFFIFIMYYSLDNLQIE